MFIRLFLFFTVVPIVELYVLIRVGTLIGTAPTIALILLTGMAGAYLARTQGFDIVRRIQSDLAQGRLPAATLLDGALVLVGGVLLLTPGFCTDLFGFSLLVPMTRNLLKGLVQHWLQQRIDRGEIRIYRP